MRRLILPGLVLAAFAYAAAAPARAEEGADAARRLYEAGTRDFEAGRFREAAAAYERAYQAQPLPAFVYNAASAYDKAGAAPEAIAGYKRYVGLPGHDVMYSILVTDINHDGINDLFLTGNFYGLKPEIGRYDANYGVTYLGNKRHGFDYLPPSQSGLFVTGEVRDAAVINTKNDKVILVARNNDALELFKGN